MCPDAPGAAGDRFPWLVWDFWGLEKVIRGTGILSRKDVVCMAGKQRVGVRVELAVVVQEGDE